MLIAIESEDGDRRLLRFSGDTWGIDNFALSVEELTDAIEACVRSGRRDKSDG